MARGGRREGAGRRAGTPNRRTVAKLMQAGNEAAAAQKQNVPRAIHTLSDLMVTAVGFTAHCQRKMVDWENKPENAGKEVPKVYVERFMLGMNTAIRAAAQLAPYQDPKFTAQKGIPSPFDLPAPPKVIEGKHKKINLKDPVEVARIYQSLIRSI